MDKTVFLEGNVSRGYRPWGPFESFEEAFSFADSHSMEGYALTIRNPESWGKEEVED